MCKDKDLCGVSSKFHSVSVEDMIDDIVRPYKICAQEADDTEETGTHAESNSLAAAHPITEASITPALTKKASHNTPVTAAPAKKATRNTGARGKKATRNNRRNSQPAVVPMQPENSSQRTSEVEDDAIEETANLFHMREDGRKDRNNAKSRQQNNVRIRT